MAIGSFGIVTPVLSVVLAVFMLGLAMGSWLGGHGISTLVKKTGFSALLFYACTELAIGLGAFAVPKLFVLGEHILLSIGEMNSFCYLSLSAIVLAASILPWCVCIGATLPFMMTYIREHDFQDTDSFSFLYLANVLGAMIGTFLAAIVCIEILGLRHTLWLAAFGNFLIAVISGCLEWQQRHSSVVAREIDVPSTTLTPISTHTRSGNYGIVKWILFSTGFIAMAMEIVWIRAFTPVLKTQVYSFAMIVFTYLGATIVGLWIYRQDRRKNCLIPMGDLIASMAITAFLPVQLNDSRLIVTDQKSVNILVATILLASICPICAFFGYLTPSLVDKYAGGLPTKAGELHAINILGCILGPLFACYFLLPYVSERHALILLALPFFAFYFFLNNAQPKTQQLKWGLMAGAALFVSVFFTRDFEGMLIQSHKNTMVRRDYSASVISLGNDFNKSLLVNGIGVTHLTSITKFMVHLPLALHKGKPESVLVIGFGMGTTYRSALSWNIDTTVVELVPSVTKAFGFYYADAMRFLNDTNGHLIIDDGRRYLKRIDKKFDIIVVDPPPPVEAAGSSMLFSSEFDSLARQHLKPDGVFAMWFPGGESVIAQAIFSSMRSAFPYVRCFSSVEGWGVHMLASMEPIEDLDTGQLAARMPETAKNDLLEWNGSQSAAAFLDGVITNEISFPSSVKIDAEIQITDDKPLNEYFFLRRLFRAAEK